MIGALLVIAFTILMTAVSRKKVLGRNHYASAFYAVVMLDTFAVWLVFPCLPGISSGVSLARAFTITLISAIALGIILLEIVGGWFIVGLLKKLGASEKVAIVALKSAWATLSPFLNAGALMIWTFFIPSFGFHAFWPAALYGGLILYFIDKGIVIPWFFGFRDARKSSTP